MDRITKNKTKHSKTTETNARAKKLLGDAGNEFVFMGCLAGDDGAQSPEPHPLPYPTEFPIFPFFLFFRLLCIIPPT
jgi:hypothetical protein